jgi:hypothetical protein
MVSGYGAAISSHEYPYREMMARISSGPTITRTGSSDPALQQEPQRVQQKPTAYIFAARRSGEIMHQKE